MREDNMKESPEKSDVIASGDRNIAIGGNVHGNVVTGDGNIVGSHSKVEIVRCGEIEEKAIDHRKLADLLLSRFSLHDISSLSFESGLDYDELVGTETTKREKVFHIIEYLRRENRLHLLVQEIMKSRPDISLNEITKEGAG
jgi:hypothetical protein